MTEFTTPSTWEEFTNTIIDRSNDLIEYGVWVGISKITLQTWMNNFKTSKEKYFAACILDSLIFRSEEQVIALAVEIFTKKLTQFLNSNGYDLKDFHSLLDILSKGSIRDLNIRFLAVSSKMDRPGKSSETIFRFIRRKLKVKSIWFIKPEEIDSEIKNGTNTFIFIDDFLGTGNQFESMWRELGFGIKLGNSISVYCPLTAHVEGIRQVESKCENVKVVPGELLNQNNNVFNYAFDDKVNTTESAKKFYLGLLEKYGFPAPLDENRFGFGNLGLAYTFNHASPDNTLNIIWEETDNWKPLIAR